jgi:two-component system, OmpR family, heavy metal sensor histidine kinase CusS
LPSPRPTPPQFSKKSRSRFEHRDRNDAEPPPRDIQNSVWNPPKIITQSIPTGNWRVGVANSPHSQIAIAVSLAALEQEMAEILNMFLIAISGILLLISGGAWMISGSALRPIQELTTAIQKITAAGLDQSVPADTSDVEFMELVQVFNQMLERLGRSFKQASRFSADAAHELKTPLAILQGELEQALYQAEPGSNLQQNLSNLLDEVRRLSGIVRKLLLLSLADAGQMSLYKVEVNLSEVLAVIVEDLDMLAPTLQIKTDFSTELRVGGDRDLLTQVLQNLMGNAIKYNVPEGWISIQAQQSATTVSVTIANSSSDNLAVDRDRIFERFYRGDAARTRKIEGVGLGLSLSREIVWAHQGSLVIDSTPVGQTAFTLILPRALPH